MRVFLTSETPKSSPPRVQAHPRTDVHCGAQLICAEKGRSRGKRPVRNFKVTHTVEPKGKPGKIPV
eukprot:953549-Amphidinium_carterae.1